MSAWSFLRAALVLMLGSAVVGGLYWALLNVPESNVVALLLSALLVIVLMVTAGATLGLGTAQATGVPFRDAIGRSIAAVPLFLVGLVLFAGLWFATTAFDDWWSAHRGEVDALAIRYLGFTRTGPLHTGVAWISWLVRWAFGLSMVLSLVVAATTQRMTAAGAGVRLSVRLWPLVASTAGVLVISQALWRLTPWRPERLAPTLSELYFAAAKLGVLYLLGLAVVTMVLAIYGRAAVRSVRL